LGKGFTEHYLAKDVTTVIAAVRNVANADTKALHELKRGNGSELIVVKIDSSSATDAKDAASALRTEHKITSIDVVIANAGIFEHPALVAEWDVEQVQRMVDINVYGLVHLFQAAQSLLKAAQRPKLAYVSSRLGSIQLSAKEALWPGAYGMSKAAGNYVVAKIAAENEWLIAYCLDPG
jgi:norsolorinic acid ketoreductase